MSPEADEKDEEQEEEKKKAAETKAKEAEEASSDKEAEGEEKAEDAGDKDASYWRGQAEALKSVAKEPVRAQEQSQPITVETLQGMGLEQREYLEKQVGKPFDDIVRSVEANERRTIRAALDEAKAKEAVTDAIEELAEAEPQSVRLRRGIKEYMADVPAADKLNPDRLKAHLNKAKIYARGKLVPSAPPTRPTGGASVDKNKKAPRPDETDEETPEMEEGEVGYGVHEYRGFKIDVKPLAEKVVGKERRRSMKHPEDPNGVKMLSSEFDDEPKFK